MNEKKALVAMSGGVDSSVAVYLMKEMGYSPIGVTMMLHENDEASIKGVHSCCTPNDIEDARIVATGLGVPFHVVNFIDGFKEKIIDKFINTYLAGETPNPCIDCNKYMKFGRLFEMAEKEGCCKVVTGHYATVEYDETQDIYRLKRSKDKTKDQTYVLYFLTQEQLSKLEFPLGVLEKTETRRIAEKAGIIVASKHDSQDICFVPDGDYAGYIEREAGKLAAEALDSEDEKSGCFTDRDGNVLGPHKGYYHYTIGQRKGLGIAMGEPVYVVDIIPDKNQVVLGSNEDLFARKVEASNFNLISLPRKVYEKIDEKIYEKAHEEAYEIEGNLMPVDDTMTMHYFEELKTAGIVLSEKDKIMRVTAKVRYRAKDTAGTLILHVDGKATMLFDEPVRAVTPGQSLVAYDGEYCIGGGIIK